MSTRPSGNRIVVILLGVLLLLVVILLVNSKAVLLPLGGAPGGGRADVASTSNLSVGTAAGQMVATTSCVARIITTKGADVWFTFGDEINQSPDIDATDVSHFQAASTTIVYDAAIYGCGRWQAISESATNITLTEFSSFR